MANTVVAGSTVSQTLQESVSPERGLVLNLHKPKNDRRVKWKQGTVDNENSGKKSSKCCCIYEKPRIFGESSSESEDSDNDEKCKGPKDYHKKAKKRDHDHEDCNCG